MNNLRRLRMGAGYTQQKLAEKAGIRRETLANIERGRYNPSLRTAQALSGLLGFATDEVFPPAIPPEA